MVVCLYIPQRFWSQILNLFWYCRLLNSELWSITMLINIWIMAVFKFYFIYYYYFLKCVLVAFLAVATKKATSDCIWVTFKRDSVVTIWFKLRQQNWRVNKVFTLKVLVSMSIPKRHKGRLSSIRHYEVRIMPLLVFYDELWAVEHPLTCRHVLLLLVPFLSLLIC